MTALEAAEGGVAGPDGRATGTTWWRDLLLLAVVVGVFYFILLGVRPLNNPDAGRYATQASGMNALSLTYGGTA